MTAYYNEFDDGAASWLEELIKRGLIADGVVDRRSILDVEPSDLVGFTQCHFFAGIGGWSHTLRLAGWPDDRPVWTGSPPCQPFSAAGAQKGKDDDRHLAPHWASLITAIGPRALFGEQVASSAVLGPSATVGKPANWQGPVQWAWIDDLFDRLEAAGYACAASDIPAAGVGAPHIRQRTFFGAVRLADAHHAGPQGHGRELGSIEYPQGREVSAGYGSTLGGSDGMAHAGRTGADHGGWGTADWLFCRDGKWRPVEPASQRMANGLSFAMGRLRDCSVETKNEVIYAAESSGFRDEVLRALRSGHDENTLRREIGGRFGFSETAILFAVLREHSRELGCVFDCEAAGRAQDGCECLQSLWLGTPSAARPSQGYEYPEQLAGKLRDALSELSQSCAQFRDAVTDAARFNASPLAGKQPARVMRLRGYGNAIVPQVAAVFIQNFEEAAGRLRIEQEAMELFE